MKLTNKAGTQSIEFSIPEKLKRISINVSGGADSSILLLMTIDYLMKNNRDDVTVSVTTCSNDFKHRWNGRKAANVINWVLEKTRFENFDLHYTYYRPEQDQEHFNEVEVKLFSEGRIDSSFNGLTANPMGDTNLVENIHGEMINVSDDALEERNIENVMGTGVIDVAGFAYIWAPFHKVDKSFVAEMYEQYDADELFDLTRSCEAVPEPGEPFDPEFEKQPCGECWWCLERKWAFGRF